MTKFTLEQLLQSNVEQLLQANAELKDQLEKATAAKMFQMAEAARWSQEALDRKRQVADLTDECDGLAANRKALHDALTDTTLVVQEVLATCNRLQAALNSLADAQDRKAMTARALGAYNVANSFAVFAQNIRDGQALQRIRGDGVFQEMRYADTQVLLDRNIVIEAGDTEFFE